MAPSPPNLRSSSSKTLIPPPSSDLLAPPPRIRRPHRRICNPSLPFASSASRRRRIIPSPGGRRSGPATPLLKWKLHDRDRAPDGPGGKTRRRNHNVAGEAVAVSARKLAAGLWQMQLPEVERRGGWIGLELNHRDLQIPNVCSHKAIGVHTSRRNGQKNGSTGKLEACAALSHSTMERATKWDPGYSRTSNEVCQIYGHCKVLEDQKHMMISFDSSLQPQLEQARSRIRELEDERRSAKKKLDHFLRKLAEEKASWRSREHEKIRNVIDAIKQDLNRERKNRQRLEIVNSKLVNELAEAKLSAKRYLQDYEKERKSRELMEEVCDELAKEIGEDKAEVEALRSESMKMREEVEEERRMLQMAEVWREERVQMKLVDAKLTLEQKYSQLTKLQADLEAFLGKQIRSDADMAAFEEADVLRQSASSINIHDIKEFSYQPPASEDIYSVFEELQQREDTYEREIEQCYGYSPASHASKIHTVSPETDVFLERPVKRYANGTGDGNEDAEDDSGWETVSHVEDQGSSNSLEGSDPSVNGIYEENNASVSGTDWDENVQSGKLHSEISEVCSTTTRQSRKKGSAIVRLWRSSNAENCKKMGAEVPNGRISNATLSPDPKSGEVGLVSSPSIGQWSSPDSLNPHITRGIKGCIEWPRGVQKHSLKAKLLEARMESQKVQLRHVLKQKI
ncbi:uncharacterized protein [Typha latifolia]|uniref:uncharacterized protein n=1 Tax=Typha latifolia TaxID=4733 RepID=UPI003C2E38BA